MTTYGLPKAVIQLLRHMEAYRDCLKWNVSEGSHKVTLTLTWSFRNKPAPPQTGKEWLFSKLHVMQRTLRLTKSDDGLPHDVSKFLESASPCSPATPPRRPPLRRQFSLGRVTWNANQWQNSKWQSMPTYPQRPHVARQASLSPPHQRNFVRGMSSRFSWPGASSPMAIRGESLDETQPTQPKTSTPLRRSKTCDEPDRIYPPSEGYPPSRLPSTSDVGYPPSVPSLGPSLDSLDSPCATAESQYSNSSQRHHNYSSVKITYRSEADIERSLEDLAERTKEQNKTKLEQIRTEWNKSMKEAMQWPVMNDLRENGPLNNSTSDSEQEVDIPETNQTVQKCLTSCDKILYRNSTVIT